MEKVKGWIVVAEWVEYRMGTTDQDCDQSCRLGLMVCWLAHHLYGGNRKISACAGCGLC